MEGRQLVVAEVAERAGHQPVVVVGPGPLVEGVPDDGRNAGLVEHRGRFPVRAPDDLEGSGTLGGSVEREQGGELGANSCRRRPAGAHRFFFSLCSCTRGSATPRAEDARHLPFDPTGQGTLDTGGDGGGRFLEARRDRARRRFVSLRRRRPPCG
jgi:hypothetical protein